jgi:hypothetical protein
MPLFAQGAEPAFREAIYTFDQAFSRSLRPGPLGMLSPPSPLEVQPRPNDARSHDGDYVLGG